MKKLLTDVHNHSLYSYDGKDSLEKMIETALRKNIAFFGVSEHFDYISYAAKNKSNTFLTDAEVYFHAARHLQEDYAGCMNVLIGAEFGYIDDERAWQRYIEMYEKYKPDFIINSVHGMKSQGWYYQKQLAGEETLCAKSEKYKEYLDIVRKSLDAPYPYDIVGHFGFLMRYAPYEDKTLSLAEFGNKIDDILKTIIQKDKILEVNSAVKGLDILALPGEEILRRYYELGGRKVSYGSDAHHVECIGNKREEVVALLKEIGFTYVTVPYRGEYIAVEL